MSAGSRQPEIDKLLYDESDESDIDEKEQKTFSLSDLQTKIDSEDTASAVSKMMEVRTMVRITPFKLTRSSIH